MNVLIVDDSIVFRTAISQALEGIPDIDIKRKLSNGKIAVDYVRSNPEIEVIIMDIEMPDVDGLEATKRIREFNKDVKIIIFSGVSESGAKKTLSALDTGANDFIPKIHGGGSIDESVEMIKKELVPRIQSLVKKRTPHMTFDEPSNDRQRAKRSFPSVVKANSVDTVLAGLSYKPELICIGSSTGGPQALMNIFRGLDHKISIPMVIVQHMPPLFTKRMASSLSALCDVEVKEANDGDRLRAGLCYIAPGDYHLIVNKDGILSVNQDEKVCYVRPSVDVFLNSVSSFYPGKTLTIILTGMGADGSSGSAALAEKGNVVLAQDEESSVVWGMPGAVCQNNSAKFVMPLDFFSQVINKLSMRKSV